jgi:hypothetical protein
MKLGRWRLPLLIGAITALFAASSSAQMPRHRPVAGYGASGIVASAYRGHPSRAWRSAAYARRVWVPGRYETQRVRVWVPEERRRVWVEPVFSLRFDLWGRASRVLVSAGYWRTVVTPGHWELRAVRTWRPGSWRSCPL